MEEAAGAARQRDARAGLHLSGHKDPRVCCQKLIPDIKLAGVGFLTKLPFFC